MDLLGWVGEVCRERSGCGDSVRSSNREEMAVCACSSTSSGSPRSRSFTPRPLLPMASWTAVRSEVPASSCYA